MESKQLTSNFIREFINHRLFISMNYTDFYYINLHSILLLKGAFVKDSLKEQEDRIFLYAPFPKLIKNYSTYLDNPNNWRKVIENNLIKIVARDTFWDKNWRNKKPIGLKPDEKFDEINNDYKDKIWIPLDPIFFKECEKKSQEIAAQIVNTKNGNEKLKKFEMFVNEQKIWTAKGEVRAFAEIYDLYFKDKTTTDKDIFKALAKFIQYFLNDYHQRDVAALNYKQLYFLPRYYDFLDYLCTDITLDEKLPSDYIINKKQNDIDRILDEKLDLIYNSSALEIVLGQINNLVIRASKDCKNLEKIDPNINFLEFGKYFEKNLRNFFLYLLEAQTIVNTHFSDFILDNDMVIINETIINGILSRIKLYNTLKPILKVFDSILSILCLPYSITRSIIEQREYLDTKVNIKNKIYKIRKKVLTVRHVPNKIFAKTGHYISTDIKNIDNLQKYWQEIFIGKNLLESFINFERDYKKLIKHVPSCEKLDVNTELPTWRSYR